MVLKLNAIISLKCRLSIIKAIIRRKKLKEKLICITKTLLVEKYLCHKEEEILKKKVDIKPAIKLMIIKPPIELTISNTLFPTVKKPGLLKHMAILSAIPNNRPLRVQTRNPTDNSFFFEKSCCKATPLIMKIWNKNYFN